MIISRTPFRISFFGGGTDYPGWYREHGGSVLVTTIDRYCYISCRYLPPFFDYKYRIIYSKIEMTNTPDGIQHPSVRAVLKYLRFKDGLEIHHDGDLPARTGLGSSSSFTVGCLNVCYALKGKMVSKERLSKEAIHIEQDINKENVGSQDQTAVAFGGLNKIDFSGDHEIKITPIILEEKIKALFQAHLMLVFTGFSRIASDVAKEQIENLKKKHRQLRQMHKMVDEAIALLNRPQHIEEFGRLLDESWQLKRSLSSKISNSQIDEIYSLARKSGVLGGKLLGAGGGGFMLLFARPEEHLRIREKLKHFLHIPFKFENLGSQIIFYAPDIKDRNDWNKHR